MGTLSEPVPVTGLTASFSPSPRRAPPPCGRLRAGGSKEEGELGEGEGELGELPGLRFASASLLRVGRSSRIVPPREGLSAAWWLAEACLAGDAEDGGESG